MVLGGRAPHDLVTPSPAGFAALARLVGEDRDDGQADVQLGPGWEAGEARSARSVVLTGRAALPAGTSPALALLAAVHRERGLRQIRRHPPSDRQVRAVHRLAPPRLGTGSRSAARAFLLGGVLLELAPATATRLLDALLGEADALAGSAALRVASGGTVLLQALVRGRPAVLRAAAAGGDGDPRATAGVLQLLEGEPLVPPLLGSGDRHGTGWTAEGLLPGARPRRLTRELVEQVSDFCTRLPSLDTPPSVDDELAVLAPLDPNGVLAGAAPVLRDRLAQLPAVLRHGDLWSGNLLVRDGHLTGVLDWDAWAPRGAPGVDLLHLLGTQQRLERRLSLGEVVVLHPWDAPEVRTALARSWAARGLSPGAEVRAAVGLAWWASQAAGDLRRTPGLAQDQRWVDRNVSIVLRALSQRRLLA